MSKLVTVDKEALQRLLLAAESVGGHYPDVHPILRECYLASKEVRRLLGSTNSTQEA